MISDRLTPLSEVCSGEQVILRRVQGGQGMASRMASLGLFPGVCMQVRRNDRSGPVVIGLHGSRVMLGRGMAGRVAVEKAKE